MQSWPCPAATSATSSSRASTVLPIPPVVVPQDDPLAEELGDEQRPRGGPRSPWEAAYDGPGIMVQSGQFTGMHGGKDSDGMKAVTRWLEDRGTGRFSINFRLRDWLISRQRYWGNPIPAIHCDSCGLVPVPESDLPVVLPMDVDITKGETLADHPEFYEVACPQCGAAARRETDTMDTFTCSSWYYIRFSDARNDRSDLGQGQGRLLDAGRSVHRRYRARHPAPALLPLLHEGVQGHGDR